MDLKELTREGFFLKPIELPYVLVVESDDNLTAMLKKVLLTEMHMQAMFATTATTAITLTKAVKPLLFLINQRLPDSDGIILHDRLHQNQLFQNVPTIILSTDVTECEHRQGKRHLTCLSIPAELDTFISTIEGVLADKVN